jgi:NAD-dependent dihydropyrimidine dehydrogenase PreA subunit
MIGRVEKASMGEIVNINDEMCLGCGACVEICPQHILYMDNNKDAAAVTDHRRCDRMKGCERVCPVGAIKID